MHAYFLRVKAIRLGHQGRVSDGFRDRIDKLTVMEEIADLARVTQSVALVVLQLGHHERQFIRE
jgi:hypothetical protein